MTTTVTITTHSWPVEVTTTDDFDNGDVHVYTATTSIQPPDSVTSYHLSSTRSIAFRELPIPHEEPAEAAQ